MAEPLPAPLHTDVRVPRAQDAQERPGLRAIRASVPSLALAALSPQQRRHLRELGLEPLRLRASPPAAVAVTATGARLHLSLRDGGVLPQDHVRIRAVLRVLELTAGDTTGAATTGLPSLSLPSLEDLRHGPVKRELWPTLRRLRRALRAGCPNGREDGTGSGLRAGCPNGREDGTGSGLSESGQGG